MSGFVLYCHPSTPCPAVRAVRAWALRQGSVLSLRYRLEGELAALRLPETGLSGRVDGLWRHACFEAFAKSRPGAADYLELNFAPSGAWAAYRFDAYREGMAGALAEPPMLAVSRGADWLELAARVGLEGWAALDADPRLALSAVVEAVDGGLSYWALAHPPGRPDFHHPENFICQPGGGPAGRAALF